MTSSNQPNLTLNIEIELSQSFDAKTIETWHTYSSNSDTSAAVIKLCFHDNTLFSSPLGSVFFFNILFHFSPEN